ncbi:hypothetical protein QTP86_017191 [Hemibagrus guttatus]|nr:hypothetical protein QTP86_017191 [Hemibagrus guttatus]
MLTPRLVLGHLEVIKTTYPVPADSLQKNGDQMEHVTEQLASTVQTWGECYTTTVKETKTRLTLGSTLVKILDEASDCSVIYKLQDFDRMVCRGN